MIRLLMIIIMNMIDHHKFMMIIMILTGLFDDDYHVHLEEFGDDSDAIE